MFELRSDHIVCHWRQGTWRAPKRRGRYRWPTTSLCQEQNGRFFWFQAMAQVACYRWHGTVRCWPGSHAIWRAPIGLAFGTPGEHSTAMHRFNLPQNDRKKRPRDSKETRHHILARGQPVWHKKKKNNKEPTSFNSWWKAPGRNGQEFELISERNEEEKENRKKKATRVLQPQIHARIAYKSIMCHHVRTYGRFWFIKLL